MERREFNKNFDCRYLFKRAAFTLLELLIAVSIFSVVIISVYSAFSAGIFSWRRLNTLSNNHLEAFVLLDSISNEVASFVPSNKVKFKGESNRISFLTKSLNKDKYDLVKLSFFFDAVNNKLIRSEQTIQSMLDADDADKKTYELPNRITALEFKYFCKNTQGTGEYQWVDTFNPDKNLSCSAVSISLSTKATLKKIVPLYVEAVNNANP